MRKITIITVLIFTIIQLYPLTKISAEEESKWETVEGVNITKEWEIEFSKEVDYNSLSGNVFVTGEEGLVDVEFRIKGNIVVVKPVVNYEKNKKYTLTVTNDVKSLIGDKIDKGMEMDFYTDSEKADYSMSDTFVTEYGNVVRVSNNNDILISDINNEESYGYSVKSGYEIFGIRIGYDGKTRVEMEYGEPLNYIDKGNKRFSNELDGEYGIYELDDKIVTFFYDTKRSNVVRSIYWIDKELEESSRNYYNITNNEIINDQEMLFLIVTNATRVEEGLPSLNYDKEASVVSRNHSIDMAKKGYFNHVNMDNQTPSDRFKEYSINFRIVGENLAFGQRNFIYAHENLMNSQGHRDNILNKEYDTAGVGLGISSDGVPYFTMNFYLK